MVPDWQLVCQLVELLPPYTEGIEFASLRVAASDRRGDYAADNGEEVEAEAERRETPPTTASSHDIR